MQQIENERDREELEEKNLSADALKYIETKRDYKDLAEGKAYDYLKAVLDVVLSIVGFIVLLPILLLIALIITIDDPGGSPLYISDRVGKNGKVFRFYKFRSMVKNADAQLDDLLSKNEADGPAFKIKDDPRITRVGRFLRKTSLDELPQLLNIIKRDMSIVGPRPPIAREVEQYTPHQRKRLSIKPGLTCLWQVQKSRNSLSFDEWVELDLEYIRRRNLWLDIVLVIKTVRVMISGDGL